MVVPDTFAAPGAPRPDGGFLGRRPAPQLARRQARWAMPEGSVTLSPLGAIVTSCCSYMDELVVGRVSEGFLKNQTEIRMGYSMWLRSGGSLTIVSYHGGDRSTL
jgi:hypothetical protein